MKLETCTRCAVLATPTSRWARSAISRPIAMKSSAGFIKNISKARKSLPAWGETKELTDMAMEELYEAAYSCTGCRRCMVYCPYGIDTQMLMSIAKLWSEPEQIGAGNPVHAGRLLSIEKGKSLELYKESFLEAIKNLEAQVVEKWKCEAGQTPIPVDQEGAEMLYVALAGAHSLSRQRPSLMPPRRTGP